MRTKKISQTAFGVAFMRGLENSRPEQERLFSDPYAYRLLTPLYKVLFHILRLPRVGSAILARRDRQLPGAIGGILGRTCYIDDALRQALAEGVEQVVILGAGLDSRAIRISGIERTQVFELDQPATSAFKRKRVEQILGTIPSHLKLIPIDFDQQGLEDALIGAGLRTDTTTFFIWEGVTQYISANAVDKTLRTIARISLPGSRMVVTFLHRGVLDETSELHNPAVLARLEQVGEPWQFGLYPTEVEPYLTERRFKLLELVTGPDFEQRYLKPKGREIKAMQIEMSALVQVSESLN